MVDNVEYKGYVPIDYTVEVLEKDITSEQYTIETLTNTYLYSDAQLTNIKDNIVIENGTAVRVYEKQENYAKIAVNVDGQWIDGYVSTDFIIDSSTIAVRNILLIIQKRILQRLIKTDVLKDLITMLIISLSTIKIIKDSTQLILLVNPYLPIRQ